MFWINQKPWPFVPGTQGTAKSLFFQVTYVLALVESCGNQNPYSGNISLKENLTVISLLYPLNQVSADMVLGVNTFD